MIYSLMDIWLLNVLILLGIAGILHLINHLRGYYK